MMKATFAKAGMFKNGSVTAVSFTLDEYINNLSSIPLYLVGYRERPLKQTKSLMKGSSVTELGYWLACRRIHMKQDQDPWSNEECEVYTGSASGYNYSTNLLFNGTYRYDAANRSVLFPDVNNTSSIYYAYGLPYFFQLTTQNQGWAAIEDDDDAGTHHSSYYGPPPVPTLPGPFYYKDVAVDVCHPDWNVDWGTVRTFHY